MREDVLDYSDTRMTRRDNQHERMKVSLENFGFLYKVPCYPKFMMVVSAFSTSTSLPKGAP